MFCLKRGLPFLMVLTVAVLALGVASARAQTLGAGSSTVRPRAMRWSPHQFGKTTSTTRARKPAPPVRNQRASFQSDSLEQILAPSPDGNVAALTNSVGENSLTYGGASEGCCDTCGGAQCAGCPTGCWPLLPCRNLWVRADYLLWWTQGMDTPPLVTSSPDGTLRDVAGVLGEPTTDILFGDEKLNDGSRSGFGISLGYWWLPEVEGIEVRYLGIGSTSTQFQQTSAGDPILGRPFFNITNGANDAFLIGFEQELEGTVSVDAATEFDSFEVLFRRALCQGCDSGLDFLLGYRYGSLDDNLLIRQSTLDGVDGIAPGSTSRLWDRFDTRNRFNGAELGMIGTVRRCWWTLELDAKLGLGNTNSKLFINGQRTVTGSQGDVVTNPEGLFAQSTNIGQVEDDQFAVIPELGVTLLYDLTCRLRATFGYRFIYWSQVMRAGDQIDMDLNLSSPLVGGERPRPLMRTTDFWAQGLSFGFDYRF